MKSVSLRTFREFVDRLDEPVRVVKREGRELRVLGTWTPQAPDNTERVDSFGTSRPAPKPGKR